MQSYKSHVTFTKMQRHGIFLLLLIIAILQGLYYYINLPQKDIAINDDTLALYQKELDALRLVKIEESQPKIFPFNPNFITDYKGYTLGMSIEEIDRLHEFRKQNKWVNSEKQFQQVTKVSDSLLKVISLYFKFPDWVTNPQPKSKTVFYNNKPKTFDQKIDLNKATLKQLQKVNGIGEKLSERIIKYRNKFIGGFISEIQLQDVYGLSDEVIERVKNDFVVKTPRTIQYINLNKASIDELVTIQHIDYEIAHQILEQRTLRQGFNSIEELLKVKGFPVKKIDIIRLYLTLN